MSKGWISIHRKLQECWIWNGEPFTRGQAWVDILLSATHDEYKKRVGGSLVTIQSGQFHTSILNLSQKWQWSEKKVRRFLKLLESDEMVTYKGDAHGTTITIINYGFYQGEGRTSDIPNDRAKDEHSTEQRTNTRPTYNNINNINNNNSNTYKGAFDEFWKNYPRKKDKARAYKCYCARLNDGYTEDQLLTACINYAAECDHNKTEERYIKHGATFLSVNEPFLDYLKGETNDPDSISGDAERDREIKEIANRIKAGDDESAF